MATPMGKSVGNAIENRPYAVYSLIAERETEDCESEVVELGWGDCK